MTARRIASALVSLAVLALAPTACDSETSDKPDSSSSPAPSAKSSQPTNRYNPQLLLTQDDLQALVPGNKLTGYKCAPYNINAAYSDSFPSNALACSAKTQDGIRVRVATAIDNNEGFNSSLDNSGLLVNTGGSTGRHGVEISTEIKGAEFANAFVSYDGEAQTLGADQIWATFPISGSKSDEYVSLVIGAPNCNLFLDRLIKATNVAGANLQKEFKKK